MGQIILTVSVILSAIYSSNGAEIRKAQEPVITIYKQPRNGTEITVQKPTQDGTEQTVYFIEGESLYMKCGIPNSTDNENFEYIWHRKLATTNLFEEEVQLLEVGRLSSGNIRPRGSSLKLNMLYNTDIGSYKCTVKKYNVTVDYCSVYVFVESIENVYETILDKNNFRELGTQELTSDRIKRFFYEINSPLKILQTTVIVREYKEDQILSCSDSVDFDEFNATWYKYKNNSIVQIESKFNLILQKLKEEDEGIYFCTLLVNMTLLYSLPFPTYRLRLFDSRTKLQNSTILYGPDSRMAYTEEATVFLCGITIENKTLNKTNLHWLFSRAPQLPTNDSNLLSNYSVAKKHIRQGPVNSTYENGLHFYPKQNSSGVGILFVTHITEADEGFYFCALNETLIRSAFLKVKTFKSDPYGRNLQNFSAPVNGAVLFTFVVEIYTFHAVLKRLGSNILEENGQIIDTKNVTTGNLSFSIPDLTKKNQGWYLIEVTMKDVGKNKIVSYLEVIDVADTAENTNLWFIMTVSGLPVGGFLFIMLLASVTMSLAYVFFRKKKITYYTQWIKKIVVEKPPSSEEGIDEILRRPIIRIDRQRVQGIRMKSLINGDYLLPLDTTWEFPRNNLELGESIGEGEFGKVVYAVAFGIIEENTTTPVAVKMLKASHNDIDMINLVSEMEMMKVVGKHMNIINLLGCCTQTGNLLIIVEYALHGNLRDFLRGCRPCSGYEKPVGPANSNDTNVLSELMQLSYALQVANGMKYLASKKCVHRDLATRNVLLCENHVVKIADFGLARDIHDEYYYRTECNDRVPIKWLAPEALFDGVYTTKSDVWSFGILLWEIMTFGGTPYASIISIEDLVHLMKIGYRMDKPDYCSNGMYTIMCKCWNHVPGARPSFYDLVRELEQQME